MQRVRKQIGLQLRACLPGGPLALDVDQDLAAAVVVAELGFQEGRQVLHHVDLGLLDVLHPAEDVFAGLLVLCLLGAQLLLHAKVLLLGLLHLGERRVVGQTARLELLAGILQQSVREGCVVANGSDVPGTPSSG